MIRRSTILVLVLFLALVGFAYYLQGPGKKASVEPTPTESSQLLFSLQAPSVELRLEKSGAETVEMNRDQQGTWKLTSPKADATDTARIETAVGQLLALQSSINLDLSPSQDAAGLSIPAYRISIKLEDGTQEIMNVGKETPTKGNYYVQVGNKGIFIVNKYTLDSFLKLVDEPPILVTPTPTIGASTPETGTAPVGNDSATPSP